MTKLGTSLRTTYDGAQLVKYRNASSGLAASDVQRAIDLIASGLILVQTQPPNLARRTINFAMSPYALQPNDYFLEVDTTGGAVTINTGLAAVHGNLPVIIKHVAGNAVANPVSIASSGGELFDGLASPIVIDFNFGGFNLQPKTGGWELVP